MRLIEESEKAENSYSKNEEHDIWFHHFMANREKVKT